MKKYFKKLIQKDEERRVPQIECITIRANGHVYRVEVGCATFSFDCVTDLLDAVGTYMLNPKEAHEAYREHRGTLQTYPHSNDPRPTATGSAYLQGRPMGNVPPRDMGLRQATPPHTENFELAEEPPQEETDG